MQYRIVVLDGDADLIEEHFLSDQDWGVMDIVKHLLAAYKHQLEMRGFTIVIEKVEVSTR